jgi:RNA polymerase sigma factor (sigma-70 family)
LRLLKMTAVSPGKGDDDALMVRVGARDGDAFRALVDRHAVMLHRLAYRMLGDAHAAEDIAQEALLRLWDHAARWRGDGPGVGAWLTRVATNLCLDRLRRHKFVSDEAVPERADDAILADQKMDEDQMKTATIACIGALAERQRAAIILTYYEDMSNADAASVLDMNIKAFESLLLRARQSLRAAFAQTGLVPDFAKRDTP